jgi:hypothetical protein
MTITSYRLTLFTSSRLRHASLTGASNVVPVHRRLKTFLQQQFYGIGSPLYRCLYRVALAFLERLEHMRDRILPVPRPPDSYLDPQKVGAADRLQDGTDTPMAPVTAADLDP